MHKGFHGILRAHSNDYPAQRSSTTIVIMWLLDAKSMRLDRIDDEEKVPPYAILSHTWANDEISFKEMRSVDIGTNMTTKAGWLKIENTCRLALEHGLSHAWVDTCCIDKSSSAELQEAINSMFKWYEYATICFAHFADVTADEDPADDGSAFQGCRWFKRGWTLQELLAPSEVEFYDKCWKQISTKSRLRELIEKVTGIKSYYVCPSREPGGAYDRLSGAGIAERMSWAAERETTRIEDLAYSLLGIFDISMPMLYGEGPKAFQGLQEEIMRVNDDSSLLGWGYQESCDDWRWETDSILAPHPLCFRNCRTIGACALKGFRSASFSMNQRGLQMQAPVRADLTHKQLVYMILGCRPRSERGWYREEEDSCSFMAIPLICTSACDTIQIGDGPQDGEYLRPNWCRPALVSEEFLRQAEWKELVIRRSSRQYSRLRKLPLSIATAPIPNQIHTIIGTYPPQPIGAQFISLCQHPVHQIAPWATNTQQLSEVQQAGRNANRNLTPVHSAEDQRMIQIEIPFLGVFLLVLDYRAMVSHRGHIPVWQCSDFRSRVFAFSEQFSLETMHRLSITQDFSHLKELDTQCQGERYMFRIDDKPRTCLEIRLEKFSQITDIYISVLAKPTSPHLTMLQETAGESLFNWLERRKRRRKRMPGKGRIEAQIAGPNRVLRD